MKKLFLAVSLMAVLTGCTTLQPPEPLPKVSRLDIDQFMGKWYVIASIPTMMDRAPFNAVQTFERGDRGIDITYTFNSDTYDGELRSLVWNAIVDNPGINTEWRVGAPWPIRKQMSVIYLEPDYSVAVMGNPARNDVKILARQKSIADPLYSDIILHLQSLGYDVGQIRRVPHG